MARRTPRTTDIEDGLQTGGTRGSSNQGGPERSGLREKDDAAKVNSREDRGSRSSTGHDPEGEES